MAEVVVCGSFDDLKSPQVRLLEDAAARGPVHVLCWSDRLCEKLTGTAPKFPLAERRYYLEAIRWTERVSVVEELASADVLPELTEAPAAWVVEASADTPAKRAYAEQRGIRYVLASERPFPAIATTPLAPPAGRKKVIVTGCYDWLHTGHVRFFEEVSEYGALYVCLGSDRNIEFLKGPGKPLQKERERTYMVGAIRYVHQAMIASGSGWLDSEAEIERIRPNIYAVNEDGDKPEKRAYCESRGIEYLVLKRLPKEGLTRRSSTALRGF